MRTICRIMMLVGVVLLSACHTTRHTVSEVGVVQDQQSSHQEQTTTQRLDSLFSKPTRKGRITIHQPRINKEERSGSNVLQQTNVADSTRNNSQTHTSTNDSKESIGGAEPPNLTAVFIVLGLGITLLIIGAILGYSCRTRSLGSPRSSTPKHAPDRWIPSSFSMTLFNSSNRLLHET